MLDLETIFGQQKNICFVSEMFSLNMCAFNF